MISMKLQENLIWMQQQQNESYGQAVTTDVSEENVVEDDYTTEEPTDDIIADLGADNFDE